MRTITRRDKILTTMILCLITAAAGDAMGRRGQMPWSSSLFPKSATLPQRPGRPMAEPTGTGRDSDLREKRRQAITRTVALCETAALWEWLQHRDDVDGELSYVVTSELYGRLGPAAFDQALKIANPNQRAALSGSFLSCIASVDPWKAMEIYDAHRSEFDPGWGGNAMSGIVMNGCNTSADLAIAAIARNTNSADPVEFESRFPPDFDFKKLADFIQGPDGNTNARPVNLQRAWATQDPSGAAAWMLEHPGDFTTFDNRLSETHTDTLSAIATSPAPGRSEALAKLTAALAPADSATAWLTLGSACLTFEPQLLDAATTMGQREAYLVPALLRTRINEELPASWAVVPAAERPALLDAVSAQWNAATPLELKALDHWRASIEQQWSARPGK
jgi:hypothetical protein